MKNKKILLIIIAAIAVSIVALAGCSKDDEAGKGGSKNNSGKGESSSVMSVKELETATNPDGTPVVPKDMEIVTNSDGTAVTNANGTVVTKPKGGPDESTAKTEPTTLSETDKKRLMDSIAANVNDYIESLGMDVDNTLTQEENEHHAVPAYANSLKNGSTQSDCKQAVDLVIAFQKGKPELAAYEVKAMYCYYEKDTFYIVFSPNVVAEETTGEAPAE